MNDYTPGDDGVMKKMQEKEIYGERERARERGGGREREILSDRKKREREVGGER